MTTPVWKNVVLIDSHYLGERLAELFAPADNPWHNKTSVVSALAKIRDDFGQNYLLDLDMAQELWDYDYDNVEYRIEGPDTEDAFNAWKDNYDPATFDYRTLIGAIVWLQKQGEIPEGDLHLKVWW